MHQDNAAVTEQASIITLPELTKRQAIDLARDNGAVVIEGRARVLKFWADEDPNLATPYDVVDSGPNLLVTAGATLMWNLLAGAGGTAYNATNSYIAVGTSTTAAAAGNTALVAEMTRSQVSGAPVVSTNTITYNASFASASANGNWNEMALVNASSGGTLFNRLVSTMGTKVSGAVWIAQLVFSAA